MATNHHHPPSSPPTREQGRNHSPLFCLTTSFSLPLPPLSHMTKQPILIYTGSTTAMALVEEDQKLENPLSIEGRNGDWWCKYKPTPDLLSCSPVSPASPATSRTQPHQTHNITTILLPLPLSVSLHHSLCV